MREPYINVLNHTPSTVHKVAPIYLMTGQYPDRPWENTNIPQAAEILRKIQHRNLENHNKHQKQTTNFKITEFELGDQVIVKNLRITDKKNKKIAKLLKTYSGPYIIKRKFGNATYELIDPDNERIKGKFHIRMIHKYYEQD